MPFNKGIQRQTFAALIATLGAMVMGTILGWSSPALTMLPEAAPLPITTDDAQAYGSVFGLGAAMGAVPAAAVSKVIGCRYGMVFYEMFIVSGWACLTVSKAAWTLIVGRTLQGVGVGALCTIIPLYVAEIAQPNVRGSLGAIFQVFVVIGILYSYALGSFVTYVPFNLLCGMWTLIHTVGVFAIPESPYFLLKYGREEEASAAMTRLRDASKTDIVKELCILRREIQQQRTRRGCTFSRALSDKANRRSLLIGIGCMFFQQASGINVVIFYLSMLFKLIGSKISPGTSMITVAVVQIVMTFLSMAIIDKVGRRKLLILSAALMSLSFFGLAFCGSISNEFIVDWLPLILIAVYISAFSLGFGPVPWVVMGEIFSTEIKPYGTILATVTNWIMVFLVTYLSTGMTYSIGIRGIFLIYGMFCLMGAAFVMQVVPETKNKTMAEIQSELASNSGATPI